MKSMILAALLIAAPAVHAEGPCKKDRETLCAGIEPGDGRLMKCMKDNADKVSAECKAHRDTMKGAMKDVREACHDDVETLCSGVKKGKGRVMKCLKANKDKLSASCKAEVEDMKKARKASKK